MIDALRLSAIVTAADPVLDRIIRTIVERLKPERVLLFGSRGRGDALVDSDYDVLIVMDTDLPPSERSRVVHELFSDRPCAMDVIVHTPAEFERKRDDVGTLAYAAVREGRVLYIRPDLSAVDAPPSRVRESRSGPPESLRDWRARAESDLAVLDLLVANSAPMMDAACFHAHQGVEKLLKCVLVAQHIPPPRTHRLLDLLEICPERLRADSRIQAACALLTELWPQSRYPGDAMPTRGQAAEAALAAHAVHGAVVVLGLW